MKKSFYTLLATGIMSTVLAISGVAADSTNLYVSLRTVGEVPPEVIHRVSDWVSGNIAPVRNDGILKTKGRTLDAIMKSVSRPEKHALVLVLVNELKGEVRHIAGKKHVVAVNLGVMRLPDMSTEAAHETFMRRVEKESVGALAAAMGMPACPMIHCALYAAENTMELDEKSRSLCPPCMQKLEELKLKLESVREKTFMDRLLFWR